jgi:DNA mismatch endonuclease, patch repair protein
MDVHNKTTRSYNMSKISSKDTTIELIVRKYLYKNGFRYRVNYKTIPGSPDIVFSKLRIVIFINGCFFHNHENCTLVKTPKSNEGFWKNKIKGNVDRDKKNIETLKTEGWIVFTVWECEIEPRKKKSPKRELTLNKLRKEILRIKRVNDTSN